MANFDQNVTINLDVDSNVQGELAAAVGQIEGAQEAAEDLDTSFVKAASGMDTFATVASEVSDTKIAPELETEGISDELDEFNQLADSLEKVSKLKDDVAQSNEVLQTRNEATADSTDSEAQSFETLMESASSLSDAKDAVANSNSVLDDQNKKTKRSILQEQLNMDALKESGIDVQQMLDSLVGKEEEVGVESRKTAMGIDEETRSFEKMMEGASDLEDAKHAVSNANQRLQNESGKSNMEILEEKEGIDATRFSADDLADSKRNLSDATRNMGDSSGAATRAIRKMRNQMDDTSDSMRAAAQVGDVFEDGLGSLSVNMGAFTIALRNFLTQVPLLLTALGAVGASALGAAAAFGTLGAAMIALPLAGAVGEMQRLKDEVAGVENNGDAMKVMMSEMKDVVRNAAQPLMEAAGAANFFENAVRAVGFVVNLVSNAIASLTEENQALQDRMEGTGETFNTVQELMGRMDGSALTAIADALTVSFALLGDEAVAAMEVMGQGLADAIVRSANLLSGVEDVGGAMSQFSDTISELAELGFKVGGGLLPVFTSFSSVVEDVAAALNSIESETAQNVITFLAFFAAVNKVSGVLSSAITLFPNVVVGLRGIAVQANAASGSMATFKAVVSGAATNIGGFLNQISTLSGFTQLIAAATGTSERMRNIAFHTDAAEEAFEELADDTDHASDQLRQLAIEGRLSQEVLEDLDDTNVNLDVDDEGMIDADQFLPQNMSSLGQEAGEELAEGADDVAFAGMAGGMQAEAPNLDRVETGGVLERASNKMKQLKGSTNSARGAVKQFAVSMKNLVAAQVKAIGASLKFALVGLKNVIVSSLKAAASIAKQTFMVWQYTGSITAAASTLWGLVTAQFASAGAAIANGLGMAMSAAMTFLFGSSATVATASVWALIASLVTLTGGLFLLVAALGGLAVGIITNFDAIKSAASDTFGFLGEIIGVIVDILLTVFVQAWNVIAALFQGLIGGLSPLIDMFMDLGEQLGLVGGKADDGAGFMEKLAAAGEVVKTVFVFVGELLQGMIAIFSGLLTIITTVIRIALTPMMIVISLIISLVQALIGWLVDLVDGLLAGQGGISGIIDMMMNMFDTFMMVMSMIPQAVEDMINFVIGLINDWVMATINAIPFVDVGTIDEVDLTGDEVEASREELAEDTENLQEGTEPEGDKNIMYNEDNSTNIDQTVNADPEDQAQLSRVVTDAINEANSFERRRQGGQ